MQGLAPPTSLFEEGDKASFTVKTRHPIAPDGFKIEEHFGNKGTEIERWINARKKYKYTSIGGDIPGFEDPQHKTGHMILMHHFRYGYYPGYDVAMCIIKNPDLLADKDWFKDGVEVGFWGTHFSRLSDEKIFIVVLKLEKGKLVHVFKCLDDEFKNHKIIRCY